MKVFLIWSDGTSHAIAEALGEWIPSVIQAVTTFVSPADARSGTGWVNAVSKELDRSLLGIVCVVPGGIGAPWLFFEVGVLSQSLDPSNVVPLLFDVKRSELDGGPLAQFPAVAYGKDAMYRILETINEKTETMRLSRERLRDTFELWWPKLELDLETVRGKGTNATHHAGAPKAVPDVQEPDKSPARTIETGEKRAAIIPLDAEEPAKSVAARPVLEEIEIELLKVLYEPPGGAPKTAADVGYKMDIPAQKVREHLDRLERKNYIREHLFTGRQKEYSIAPKGREFLARNAPGNRRVGG